MKLNCGLSPQDKWKARQEWHLFFAIWPRRVGKLDCRAFETIERRRVNRHAYSEWEYRAING
jgi:hypothetical protein